MSVCKEGLFGHFEGRAEEMKLEPLCAIYILLQVVLKEIHCISLLGFTWIWEVHRESEDSCILGRWNTVTLTRMETIGSAARVTTQPHAVGMGLHTMLDSCHHGEMTNVEILMELANPCGLVDFSAALTYTNKLGISEA